MRPQSTAGVWQEMEPRGEDGKNLLWQRRRTINGVNQQEERRHKTKQDTEMLEENVQRGSADRGWTWKQQSQGSLLVESERPEPGTVLCHRATVTQLQNWATEPGCAQVNSTEGGKKDKGKKLGGTLSRLGGD